MSKIGFKNKLVISSNDLVHAKYDFTLWQKRVFVYAISQIEKDEKEFQPIRMNVVDIIKFFKASRGVGSYNAILETPKSLNRTIEVPYLSSDGFKRIGHINLLAEYTLPSGQEESNQYIEILFNNKLKPHLIELKEKFLKYDISNIIDLQSTYSFRMFEILKSYEYKKSVELEVDYLKEILDIQDKYANYGELKKYIIEKAKKDLRDFCDISFEYEEIKAPKSKKVVAILFHIFKSESNKEQNKQVEKKRNPEINLYTQAKADEQETDKQDKFFLSFSPVVVSDFGVSPTTFVRLLSEYTEGEIIQAIEITKGERDKGKLQNVAGFFIEALKNKYQKSENVAKQKNVEKKANLEAEAQKEQAQKSRVEEVKRKETERKMYIIRQLINDDLPIIHQAIADIQNSMFSTAYNAQKTVIENLENPMFMGGLMNALLKIDATVFNI